MKKVKGKLPKIEGNYIIETKSGKHVSFYNKMLKKFLWDMNSPIGCSVENAKNVYWWENK